MKQVREKIVLNAHTRRSEINDVGRYTYLAHVGIHTINNISFLLIGVICFKSSGVALAVRLLLAPLSAARNFVTVICMCIYSISVM